MHRESLVPKKLTCMLYHHNEEDVRMLDFGDVCFRQPCGPCWMQLRHWSTVAVMSVLRDELWQEKDLDCVIRGTSHNREVKSNDQQGFYFPLLRDRKVFRYWCSGILGSANQYDTFKGLCNIVRSFSLTLSPFSLQHISELLS